MDFEFTPAEKRKRVGLEILELLRSSAFPLMIQIIFGVSIFLFAFYNDDIAIQLVATIGGEIMTYAAYVIFGRSNGIAAYRKYAQAAPKRAIGTTEVKYYFKTGEYAVWKGFVIGLITTIPYVIIQLIECCAHNKFCSFLLMYAFGWAYAPFSLAKLSPWLNFIWVPVIAAVHGGAYIWGRYSEEKKQMQYAEQSGKKGKKKK